MKTSKALNKNKKRIQIEDASSDSEVDEMVQTIDESDSEVSDNESETEQSTYQKKSQKKIQYENHKHWIIRKAEIRILWEN